MPHNYRFGISILFNSHMKFTIFSDCSYNIALTTFAEWTSEITLMLILANLVVVFQVLERSGINQIIRLIIANANQMVAHAPVYL